MLIPFLFTLAAAAGQPAPAPEPPPARDNAAAAERLLKRQEANGPAGRPDLPPMTGAEAAAIQAQYIRSIGHPLQPANDSLNTSGADQNGSSGR